MSKEFYLFWSVIIFGWLSFYGCTATDEKNNSISIEASLDTTQVTIGDVIHFTVEVRGVSNQRLVFSELNVGSPVEIKENPVSDSNLGYRVLCNSWLLRWNQSCQ